MKRVLSILFAASVALFATAQAGTVYNYTKSNLNQRAQVGQIEYLSISYDTDEKLSFKATLGKSTTGEAANGGWFVLSPGTNPKNSARELAIFYMNFETGDVYAYRYDGRDGSQYEGIKSYKNYNSYITTYYDVLNVTGDENGLTVEFDDLFIAELAPGLFGKNWTGASFGEEIGIWLHFTTFNEFKVYKGKKVKYLSTGPQSWYDVAYRDTTEVSEPLGFALAGLFLAAGLVVARRRRQPMALATA